MKELSYVKSKLIQENQFIQTNPKIKDLGILGSHTQLTAKCYLTLQILLFTSFILMFLDCNTIAPDRKFIYTSKGTNRFKERGKLTLAITPFDDLRQADSIMLNQIGIIPLILWATDFKDRPESDIYIFYPREQIPEAIRDEFEATNYFALVKLSERAKPVDFDYFIRGEILSTKEKTREFYYGLSFYRGLFWLLGAPTMSEECNLKIRLSLVETRTDKVLFSEVYEQTQVTWIDLLHLDERRNFHNYVQLAGQIIPDFVENSLNLISGKGIKR